jgi:hypothetical protein
MSDNYKTSKTNTAACWFVEGQANLFVAPIDSKGDPSRYRNFEIDRLFNVYQQGRSFSKEQWLAVFNDLKNNKSMVEKEHNRDLDKNIRMTTNISSIAIDGIYPMNTELLIQSSLEWSLRIEVK